MKIIRQISWDEMILEFLLSELDSIRFKEGIIKEFQKYLVDEDIVIKADLTNKNENEIRLRIFEEYRGFNDEDGLFTGFPKDIRWFYVELSKEELLSVYYIDWSYWNLLSNKTRLPLKAAGNIKKGIEIYEVSNEGFYQASREYRRGKKYKKLILVGENENRKIVVLEGHLRLTVYAMNEDILPNKIEVILGFSKDIAKWDCF